MTQITKTMQKLLDRRAMADSYVSVDGKREADAARALVAAGLAVRVDISAELSAGTYYDHFGRSFATRKWRCVIGGRVYFA